MEPQAVYWSGNGIPANSLDVKVKYFNKELIPLEMFDQGDWVDLRSAETLTIGKGEFKLIPLGVAIELPPGYEALVVPRSSTYRRSGIIQANSVGVIDNSYCGNEDQWYFPAIAMRKTTIRRNDRICQFRVIENQISLNFNTVDELTGNNRGGFGSTGVQ